MIFGQAGIQVDTAVPSGKKQWTKNNWELKMDSRIRSFRAGCPADGIESCAKESSNSHAIKKKDEMERVPRTWRTQSIDGSQEVRGTRRPRAHNGTGSDNMCNQRMQNAAKRKITHSEIRPSTKR